MVSLAMLRRNSSEVREVGHGPPSRCVVCSTSTLLVGSPKAREAAARCSRHTVMCSIVLPPHYKESAAVMLLNIDGQGRVLYRRQ